MKTEILFEDKLIAVCLKPAGIISQGSQSGEDMISILNGHFIQSGSDARAFPVHRLDRETAGLMVYAKNSAAAARLSKQAEQNEIKKRYFAILRGVPETKPTMSVSALNTLEISLFDAPIARRIPISFVLSRTEI